jgi:hypothetical protein
MCYKYIKKFSIFANKFKQRKVFEIIEAIVRE